MRQFKAGEVHILVATDVAAKGLDFPDIQHVINFDMPEEIENYVSVCCLFSFFPSFLFKKKNILSFYSLLSLSLFYFLFFNKKDSSDRTYGKMW